MAALRYSRAHTASPLLPRVPALQLTAYEALIPMGLVGVMFFVTGTGYNALARYRNDGKVSQDVPSRTFELQWLTLDSSSPCMPHPHTANQTQHR